MKKIVFATGNPNKVREVSQLLGHEFSIVSLQEIGCPLDLPETNPTLVANAIQKAQYVFDHFGTDCFAEDSGLEIDALSGEPGVFSARYAGEAKNDEDNLQLVLEKMKNETNRRARFRTVVALIMGGKINTFEGTVEGVITTKKAGTGGFGYDPVFQPQGYDCTFAEMPREEKNKISHRGKAVRQLVAFLKSLNN